MIYESEPSDCKRDWKDISTPKNLDRFFCKTHGKTFSYDEPCPLMIPPTVSTGTFPKGESDKSISEPITKKVTDKHKFSYGLYGVVTDLYQKGYGIVAIAKIVGVSHPYVSRIVKRMASPTGGKERFHNYSVMFNALVPYDYVELKEVKLKGWSYKMYKDDEFYIQIMRDKVLVRYLKDIVGLRIHTSEESAIQRIKEFIESWNLYHIQFYDFVVSSGHNEFMNNPIAHHVASKGQRVKYKDRVDGRMRTTIDFSKSQDNPSGAPMFEHEHPEHFVPDSEKWEGIIHDVASNNYDPLNVTKDKLDKTADNVDAILTVQKEYASAINKHLDVEERKLQNEKRTSDLLEKQNQAIDRQTEVQNRTLKAIEHLGKESRQSKTRKLLRRFGW